jgi:hypothetical protein
MVAFFGEERGCIMFRKIAPWYTRTLGPSVFFRREVHALRTRAQFDDVLARYREWRRRFLDADGELAPRYRSESPYSSFMTDENADGAAAMARNAIKVPKGPVATW